MKTTSSQFAAPVVSVVIPAYRPDFQSLMGTIRSVRSQATKNLTVECLVVFDGFPERPVYDSLAALADESRSDSFVLRVEGMPHAGVSAARNRGTAVARGTWLCYVDDDDQLLPGALQALVSYGETHQCDVVQGSYETVAIHLRETHAYADHDEVLTGDGKTRWLQDVLSPDKGASLVWSKIFRRDVIVDNAIRFDGTLVRGEDTVFVWDASVAASTIGYIDFPVYQYRRSAESAVSGFNAAYCDQIMDAVLAMREHVKRCAGYTRFTGPFRTYVLYHLVLVDVHFVFNSNAPWNNRQRRAVFSDVLAAPVFHSALTGNAPASFGIAKKITFWVLKLRLYGVNKAIAMVRMKQIAE
ncbi:MAG: glycosyltransferase [Aeriscardovia sp.]|nr:glycosyltransferase [Aeriscardovia sp.]